MHLYLYVLLLIYFFLGAIATAIINKKRAPHLRKKNWLKFVIYFVIVSLLFFSILFNFFPIISGLIIASGCFELVRLIIKTKNIKTGILGLVVFSVAFFSFYSFSFLQQSFLFYTLFIVAVFDAFSQITGQFLGKRKLFPLISPDKTLEGLAGGFIMAGITAMAIRELLDLGIQESMAWTIGITAFAFAGDLFASFIKRRFGVKDFSKLIPGHGGFLDRFDSLIFSSLFIQLMINCFYR